MQTALLSYFPGMYYYMDPTYVLVIIGAVICMLASANVSRTFNKYSRYSPKGEAFRVFPRIAPAMRDFFAFLKKIGKNYLT